MNLSTTRGWLNRYSRMMKRQSFRWSVAILVGIASVWNIQAARISEPSTVLYGRIVERVGDREFLFTSGRLVWNLRTTGPGAKDYQLTAQLEPLGAGRFSYRLSIPHEVLAYDLTVKSKAVGLGVSRSPVQHLSVTLDGRPVTINPAAVEGFGLDQASRASALRIDLALGKNSTDSDGDGLPDWWEDLKGLNKFDPSDASTLNSTPPQPADPASSLAASQATTLAEWRSIWFPNNSADLATFAQEDPDQDGIPNLLEYAFDLDPTQPDGQKFGSLPHAVSANEWAGVSFHRRAGAADLNYQVELSDDLFHWRNGSQEVELAPADSTLSTAGQATYRTRLGQEETRFFRVRVQRQ